MTRQSSLVSVVESNVAATAATPLESVLNAYYELDRLISGDRINPDSKYLRISNIKQHVRSATFQSIKDTYGEGTLSEKIASLGYEIFSNRGDSLMNSLAFGSLFGFSGKMGDILNELLGASPMGATASMTAAAEAIRNGATQDQAWLIAGTTFLFETFTEAITYSNIKEALGTTEELSADTLKQFFLDWVKKEGPEEMLGETITEYFENAASSWAASMNESPDGYKGAHQELVDKYLAEGYGDQAEEKAYGDELNNLMHTAFVSYLSAGMGLPAKAVKSAWNGMNYYRGYTRSMQKMGDSNSMFGNMLNDYKRKNGYTVYDVGDGSTAAQAADQAAAQETTGQTEAQEYIVLKE